MVALKLSRQGDSTAVVLPDDVLTRMKLSAGDIVYLTEAPDGYRLTPYEPAFEDQMDAARRIMTKRRNVLRELAK